MSGENPVFRRIENVSFHLGRWGGERFCFELEKKISECFGRGTDPACHHELQKTFFDEFLQFECLFVFGCFDT